MKRSALRLMALLAVVAAGVVASSGSASASGNVQTATAASGCIAHHPNYVENQLEVAYPRGCTGHDEPELDPLSTAAGSAKDLTWKAILPTDGVFPVAATGFGFWWGGTLHVKGTLSNEGFLELQFYPDSMVTHCGAHGGFNVKYAANTYTACSPVWVVTPNGRKEYAAFNAMLTRAGGTGPLVMHAGDTITVHQYETPAADGTHITVNDLTTGDTGTIIVHNSTYGAMNPEFGVQKIGNALSWGAVHDAPNSFVWEIGHASIYSSTPGAFCIPGDASGNCQSFNAPAWAGTTPIHILGVSYGGGTVARHWAVVTDTGGKAEVLGQSFVGPTTCKGYGGPYCIYPWYSQNTDGSFSFGVHYPTTAQDFGRAGQYSPVTACGSPLYGPNSTYCAQRIQ